MLEQVNEFILTFTDGWWMLFILFAFCLIDGFFPIVPSESLLVGIAALGVHHSPWFILGVWFAGAAGAFLGDQICYRIGRRIGTDRWGWLRQSRVQQALRFANYELYKRGALLIFTARFIPLGRVAVNLTAGATGYSLRRFTILDAISTSIWSAYSMALGALAGAWLDSNPLLAMVVAVAIALLLGMILDYSLRRIHRYLDERGHARWLGELDQPVNPFPRTPDEGTNTP